MSRDNCLIYIKHFLQQTIKSLRQLTNSQKIFFVFFLIFIFLGLFLRYYKLGQIPVSYYHDEMDYVFTGEALARYGTDITGQWWPGQLRPLKTLNYTAEIPAYFHAVAQLVFGFGPSSGHIPAAVFGLFTVVMASFFVYLISKNYLLSLTTFIILLLNPWHVHLSRMAYEAVISLFFQIIFLLSLYLIASYQKKKITLPLMFYYFLLFSSLILSYFTYHGTKFLAPVLVFASCLWMFAQKQTTRYKFFFASSLILLIGILLFYTWQLQQAGQFGLRNAELINFEYIGQLVDKQRKLSFANWTDQIFINKPTVLIRELLARYLFVFDPYRLAISGYESGFQFSLIVHGFFYLSSIPLFFFGIKWWLKNYRHAANFLLLFLIISPIVSVITIGYQAIFRSALTYLILSLFVAGGVFNIILNVQEKKKKVMLSIIVLLFSFLEMVNFTYNYLSRYGFVSADNHYFFEELLAAYVKRSDQAILILVDKGKAYSVARSIVAYNQLMPVLSQEEKKQFGKTTGSDYHLQKIDISENCPNLNEIINTVQIIDLGMFERCHYADFIATASSHLQDNIATNLLSISSPIDSGAYYFLLNDSLCDQNKLNFFVYTDQLADFNPDRMSNEDFCQTWIKRER